MSGCASMRLRPPQGRGLRTPGSEASVESSQTPVFLGPSASPTTRASDARFSVSGCAMRRFPLGVIGRHQGRPGFSWSSESSLIPRPIHLSDPGSLWNVHMTRHERHQRSAKMAFCFTGNGRCPGLRPEDLTKKGSLLTIQSTIEKERETSQKGGYRDMRVNNSRFGVVWLFSVIFWISA